MLSFRWKDAQHHYHQKTAYQNHSVLLFRSHYDGKKKKKKITSVDEDVEKLEPTAGGIMKRCNHCGKQHSSSFQN